MIGRRFCTALLTEWRQTGCIKMLYNCIQWPVIMKCHCLNSNGKAIIVDNQCDGKVRNAE